MFVKFGEKEHMLSLKENGAMWFNPCKKFREWEKEDGIKDCDDGGIRAPAETIRIVDQEGNTKVAKDISFGLTVEPAFKVPVFCLYQTSENFLSDEKIRKIRQKFPDYDSALLIEDEFAFLENVRYSFKSRAFCHTIFYQDRYEMEFVDFLEKGESDVSFYKPQKKNRYYADVKYDRNRPIIPRPLQNRQPHRFSAETGGAKLLNGITTGEQASRAMRKTVL